MSNQEEAYKNLNQDIIDGCIAGDQKAQFKLYKLYYRSMYNTSLRIVNDYAEAEDIMQDSFLAAYEKIDSYSGKVSFGSWLKKIVVNKSLDALRKSYSIKTLRISLQLSEVSFTRYNPDIILSIET
jgi:RNA polymerase sigma-70 factor (ECF subfamily)